MVVGMITTVDQPQVYGTEWGEMLFTGRRVKVITNCLQCNCTRTMYIKSDSAIGLLCLTNDVLKSNKWEIHFHGELLPNKECYFVIDKLYVAIKTLNEGDNTKIF